ncbi:putative quorum-sensing-regulated virulence factor [Sulfurimonas sp.]
MMKAQLIFTKNRNSFTVFIKNLEELSVEQIQVFQKFCDLRHGYFDFDRYSFTIQKNFTFSEFVKIIKSLEIDAKIFENLALQKSSKKINFGKFKGMLYSELPDSYLSWLKHNYSGEDREIISKELKNRNI